MTTAGSVARGGAEAAFAARMVSRITRPGSRLSLQEDVDALTTASSASSDATPAQTRRLPSGPASLPKLDGGGCETHWDGGTVAVDERGSSLGPADDGSALDSASTSSTTCNFQRLSW